MLDIHELRWNYPYWYIKIGHDFEMIDGHSVWFSDILVMSLNIHVHHNVEITHTVRITKILNSKKLHKYACAMFTYQSNSYHI